MNSPVANKSIIINAPIDIVWNLIYDVINRTAWDVSIESLELLDEMRVGAKGKIVPKNGPSNAFTVTQLEPFKCLQFTSQLMWSKLEFNHILKQRGNETEVTFDMQCVGTQVGVVANMFRSIFSNNLDKVLPNLKQLAEKRSTAVEKR